jgi:hypothetical protein
VSASNMEAIDVEALPTANVTQSNSHLFCFLAGLSGAEKMDLILQHEYTSVSSEYNGKIALYTNRASNSNELLYSNFTRYKSKAFTTCNVVNAFFYLMN